MRDIFGMIIAAAIVVASVVVAYKVATSDLPFWFKFWLLR